MGVENKKDGLSTFDNVWNQYCGYAATAREKKAYQEKWQKVVLLLAIIGAAVAALSQNLAGIEILAKVLGIISGGMIALSAYFSKEFIKPEKERLWVQARSIAEALKSEAYLYVTGTPPYDKDAPKVLGERADELENKVSGFTAKYIQEGKKKKKPSYPMTIENYIEERVKEQTNEYYIKRADEHEKYANRWNNVRWVFGAMGVVLGVLNGVGFSQYLGGWLAFISTVTATMAAHLSVGRHNYLVLSYRSEAQILKKYLGNYTDGILTAQELVKKCEEAISSENKTWLLEWTKDMGKLGST